MMKSIGFILLIFCIISQSSSSGWAMDQDFLHGEVLTVDGSTVLLRTDAHEENNRVVTVVLPETLMVDSPGGELSVPDCLVSGRHVRVWGVMSPSSNGSFFTANEVRGCGRASCSDPTGVRSRLSQNRGRKNKGEVCQ